VRGATPQHEGTLLINKNGKRWGGREKKKPEKKKGGGVYVQAYTKTKKGRGKKSPSLIETESRRCFAKIPGEDGGGDQKKA